MTDDWVAEQIPNTDSLFMRVHKQYVRGGELQPGVFKDRGRGMSTNWQKYCATAEDARRLARHPPDNGVVRLNVGQVRDVPLIVEHTPNRELSDRSHTDVLGEKSAEVRLRLLELAAWEIGVS